MYVSVNLEVKQLEELRKMLLMGYAYGAGKTEDEWMVQVAISLKDNIEYEKRNTLESPTEVDKTDAGGF